ncbi:MAG: alpha/beta hydrolase [Arenimonas sp.]
MEIINWNSWLLRIAVLMAISCATCASARDERVIDDAAYTKPKSLVEVEPGRRLNLYCTGKGGPVVIFDAGLGDSTKAWGLVQREIAKEAKACSYDRAGLGFSDPAKVSGTSRNAVKDLHRLLQSAKLAPPYILVGHSYGGMNVKLYAEVFPLEVSGLVLVDPSHEDLGSDISALDPESGIRNKEYLADLKRCIALEHTELIEGSDLYKLCVGQTGDRYSKSIKSADLALAVTDARIAAWISEMSNVWTESADEVRSAYRRLGDIPIIVLTKEPAAPGENESIELRAQKNSVWIRLHDAIAGMSTRGERITVPDSGHYIQLDQPATVIAAIRRVLQRTNQTDTTGAH